jgi:DNA-binding MarR family transcriptional regulator
MVQPLQCSGRWDTVAFMDEPGTRGLEWGLFGERVGPVVRLLRNELTLRILSAQARYDLHSGALSAMVLIDANPGCSQSDLARELALDKSVLVAIVDDLESRGLARRARSTADRRRNSLKLTDAGKHMMATMFASANAVEQPIRDALSEAEIAALIRLLRRAYGALIAADPPPPTG